VPELVLACRQVSWWWGVCRLEAWWREQRRLGWVGSQTQEQGLEELGAGERCCCSGMTAWLAERSRMAWLEQEQCSCQTPGAGAGAVALAFCKMTLGWD